MLSYRHAFHAGNHADVLKHFVLICLLRHLALKDKAFWVIDTHAGAGAYGLDAGYATKNGEFEGGIARLWPHTGLPAALTDYLDLVRAMNPAGKPSFYPGSPYLAAKLLRPQDRLRLFEMHPTDVELLGKTFQGDKRVQVTRGDGFAGLKALLPPPSRRGLVLIDPSYEDKGDYTRVVEALKDSLKRFPTGTYAVWYPILSRPEARRLPERLRALRGVEWLDVSLSLHKASTGEPGMSGSGMFVVNPPWTLGATLRDCMPTLKSVLATADSGSYQIETSPEPQR